MWTTEQLVSESVGGRVGDRFCGLDEVNQLDKSQLMEGAARALARPQTSEVIPGARPLSRRLLAAQWTLLLEQLQLPPEPKVLELCAGGSDPVIVALDVLFGAKASYITINLNRKLAAQLMERAAGLKLPVRVIEDDVRNLASHFPDGSFDCICFHHAVNDILQTAVAAKHGWDTRDLDWWPNERQMIEWLGQEHEKDGLASVGLPELRDPRIGRPRRETGPSSMLRPLDLAAPSEPRLVPRKALQQPHAVGAKSPCRFRFR